MEIKKDDIKKIIHESCLVDKIIDFYAELAKIFYETGYRKGFQDGCFKAIDEVIKESNLE